MPTEVQEPYAVVVLLEKDFIVVDLTQSKWVHTQFTSCTSTCNKLSQRLITSEIHMGVIDMLMKNHRAKHDCKYACQFLNDPSLSISPRCQLNMLLLWDRNKVNSTCTVFKVTLYTSCSLCYKAFYTPSLNTNIYILKCLSWFSIVPQRKRLWGNL